MTLKDLDVFTDLKTPDWRLTEALAITTNSLDVLDFLTDLKDACLADNGNSGDHIK